MSNDQASNQNPDILDRLLHSENRLKQKVQDARKRADNIVEKATHDGEAMVQEARKHAEEVAKQRVDDAKEEVSRQPDNSTGRKLSDPESFRQRAERNRQKAVTRLVKWVAFPLAETAKE